LIARKICSLLDDGHTISSVQTETNSEKKVFQSDQNSLAVRKKIQKNPGEGEKELEIDLTGKELEIDLTGLRKEFNSVHATITYKNQEKNLRCLGIGR
jgi:hypothetical protein